MGRGHRLFELRGSPGRFWPAPPSSRQCFRSLRPGKAWCLAEGPSEGSLQTRGGSLAPLTSQQWPFSCPCVDRVTGRMQTSTEEGVCAGASTPEPPPLSHDALWRPGPRQEHPARQGPVLGPRGGTGNCGREGDRRGGRGGFQVSSAVPPPFPDSVVGISPPPSCWFGTPLSRAGWPSPGSGACTLPSACCLSEQQTSIRGFCT